MPSRKNPCVTEPFLCQGEKQFVIVEGGHTVRRHTWKTKAVVDETFCPVTRAGCAIEEIAVSPSGRWLVSLRNSGQGESGYDVFRTCPLARVAGTPQKLGYMLDIPQFSANERFLIGGFGAAWLSGWWRPGGDPEEPARSGKIRFGYLLVHSLPSQRVRLHELKMDLPKGWIPDDPWEQKWYGARHIVPAVNGIRLTLPGDVGHQIKGRLPKVILLPTPHPAGGRLLSGGGKR